MEKVPYGYCGMPCALCSRYRTTGTSRCPGCSAGGYYTDGCKVYACCREKGFAHCALCPEYLCPRLGRMKDFSDLNTGGAKRRTGAAIAEAGFDAWYGDYCRKAKLLTQALEQYNDGRMKRYLCEVFLQNETPFLEGLMARAAALTGTPKEKGKAFRALAIEMAHPEPCPAPAGE